MIYLDNSATTRVNESVLASFQHVASQLFANPSSIHNLGGEVEQLLRKSREQIAQLLAVEDEEIIFTSGGTEGNNLAIKGIALEHQNRGKHIITTAIEHPSVFDACQALEGLGFTVTYLDVDQYGRIDIEELKQAMTEETILVSIMHVNNETGVIQPIKEIGEVLAAYPRVFFHFDHAHGLGKVPLHSQERHVDLCTLSGHKIHGLKGTGVLYVNKRVSLFPLAHGGNQEFGVRSGTENVAGAIAFARALRLIFAEQEEKFSQLKHMSEQLREAFNDIDRVVINSPIHDVAPHILNVSVPGIKSEVMIHALEKENIYISTK